MNEWRTCIVTFFDLAGVKKLAEEGTPSEASDLMRKLHDVVEKAFEKGMLKHDCAYAWNDSVMLLAFPATKSEDAKVMRECDLLKRKVDSLGYSYAKAVKGKAFPSPPIPCERVTRLKTSSYAMANCFGIEKQLGNKKKPWYVDGRIGRNLDTKTKHTVHYANMLPTNRPRHIFLYDGYLWP